MKAMGRDDEGVNVILHIPFGDNELPKGRAQVCYLCVLRSQNLIAMQKNVAEWFQRYPRNKSEVG